MRAVLARLWRPFAEAPVAPRLADAALVAERYAAGRSQVLLASMTGYGLFYFCRKNLSVALPLMSLELGLSDAQLGILGSLLYVTYGIAKFGSGLLADRANPRTFMLAGLVLTALANLAFGLSGSLVVFGALWAVNGVFQSTGAPASSKVLATWFGAGERGTKTAIWNISHQGGGGLVLVIAGLFAARWGWRGAFVGPALLTLVLGLVVTRFLRDRPESEGLPPIEEHRHEEQAGDDGEGMSFGRLFVTKVLQNRRVWMVALASSCTYIVRYGALDWGPKYLFEVRHLAIEKAGLSASLLEFIGIPGALLCGWLSDSVFRARRAPVVFASLVLLAGSIWLLFRVPADSPWLDAGALALVGFFTYGPQMLLAGVAPVDLSSRRVAAAAVGFTGLVSYFGATISSSVTGLLKSSLGWQAAFNFWIVAALAAAALCLPLWNDSAVRAPAPEPEVAPSHGP